MAKRETVGKAAYDLMLQDHKPLSPVEYEREMHKEYEAEVYKCLEDHKPRFEGDFYIVVTTKQERLLHNVLRNFFFGRKSCPTPTYDQTVYKYHRSEDKLEFLWVIPDQVTCNVFKRHALEVVPDERELLHFVVDFFDGALDKKAQLLNNEITPDGGSQEPNG